MIGDADPRVYCVIPVHNRCAITARCLDQLVRQTYPSLSVIVVDDGSTDGTAELLRSFKGLDLEVIRGSGSLWWGGAVQLGMQHVDGCAHCEDLVLLLNDDVLIADNFVESLVLSSKRLGGRALIGCVQCETLGQEAPEFGFRLDRRRATIQSLTVPVSDVLPFDVDAICGRGLLVPVPAMRQFGYVDAKRFQHFWGDLDYSARAAEFGWRVVCDPNVRVLTAADWSNQDSQRNSASFRRFFSRTSSQDVYSAWKFWMRRASSRDRPLTAVRLALMYPPRLIRRGLRNLLGIRSH